MRKTHDILEIKSQSLGLLLADFHICQQCHIVDRDSNRIMVGHPCSNCGTPSPSGRMYFNSSVYSLINLMQEFYHKDHSGQSADLENDLVDKPFNKKNSRLAVIIFFATLREVLLKELLYDLMIAQKLSGDICKRLFSDSLTHRQRLDKLFPSLSGVTWKKAIKKVNNKCELDFIELDDFIETIIKARNKFLHRGSKRAITNKMADQCLEKIWSLLNLYVYLNNEYRWGRVCTIYSLCVMVGWAEGTSPSASHRSFLLPINII